jgi:hypothetical protein
LTFIGVLQQRMRQLTRSAQPLRDGRAGAGQGLMMMMMMIMTMTDVQELHGQSRKGQAG